jgi:cathepsin L
LTAVAAIESRTSILNNITARNILPLSSLQLSQCVHQSQCISANLNMLDCCFDYAITQGGLCSASEYQFSSDCSKSKADQCATLYDPIVSFTDVTPNSASDLEAAVAEGPVAVFIEADQTAFQFYSSGILSGVCGAQVDHTLLAVGYGSSSGNTGGNGGSSSGYGNSNSPGAGGLQQRGAAAACGC